MFGKHKAPVKDEMARIQFTDYCVQSVDMHNFIISGGNLEDRAMALYTLLQKARTLRLPVIILQAGNAYLTERPLSSLWRGQIASYDPALDKSATELADLLTDVGVNALGTDRKVFVLIQLIINILEAIGNPITLRSVLEFPCDRIMIELDRFVREDIINESQRRDFVGRFSGAAGECVADTSRLFSRLKNAWNRQVENKQGQSLQATIDQGGIIAYDLVTDTNSALKELCFADVNLLMQRGEHFLLIVDGLSIFGKDECHTDTVLMRNHGNISLLYSASDVPQMMLQRDEYFNTLVGGHANLVLFRHNNARSAQKWSDFFGQEWVTLTETSVGKSKENTAFITATHTQSTSTRTERHDKFPPERFTNIPEGQGKGFLIDCSGISTRVAQVKMPMIGNEVRLCLQ